MVSKAVEDSEERSELSLEVTEGASRKGPGSSSESTVQNPSSNAYFCESTPSSNKRESLVSVNKEAETKQAGEPCKSSRVEGSPSLDTHGRETPPAAKSLQRDTSLSLPSISVGGFLKGPESHTDAYDFQTVYHKAPDESNPTLRWTQSAKSIFKDTQKKNLDWKQRARIQGQNLLDKFKRSGSRETDCLTPPHLLRPPDNAE